MPARRINMWIVLAVLLGPVLLRFNWQAIDSKQALRSWETGERSLVSAESAPWTYFVLTVFLLLVPLQKLNLDGALRARLWRGFGAPLRPDRANGDQPAWLGK